jgi:hypothetical protein
VSVCSRALRNDACVCGWVCLRAMSYDRSNVVPSPKCARYAGDTWQARSGAHTHVSAAQRKPCGVRDRKRARTRTMSTWSAMSSPSAAKHSRYLSGKRSSEGPVSKRYPSAACLSASARTRGKSGRGGGVSASQHGQCHAVRRWAALGRSRLGQRVMRAWCAACDGAVQWRGAWAAARRTRLRRKPQSTLCGRMHPRDAARTGGLYDCMRPPTPAFFSSSVTA